MIYNSHVQLGLNHVSKIKTAVSTIVRCCIQNDLKRISLLLQYDLNSPSPWVWVEEVSLLERVGYEPEGALPGAVEQVEGAVHPLPVLQVEERVRYRLGVAPLCYRIWRSWVIQISLTDIKL